MFRMQMNNDATPIILCENLVKIYKVADLEVVALQGLDLVVRRGEMLGIVGTSGSGKSTLMNILGGLDRPSAGRVTVDGLNLLSLTDATVNRYQREKVGFVWQQTSRNLIPYLTAQENVELPMTIAWNRDKHAKEAWSKELLEAVGLYHREAHKLTQLSGGEQQRVAIAVALANKPCLLLGDEPTGEVDSTTAQTIMETFRKLGEAMDLTIVIVTHDPRIASMLDRVVAIRDGKISTETIRQVSGRLDQRQLEQAMVGEHPDKNAAGREPQKEVVYHEYVVLDSAGRLQIPRDLLEVLRIGKRAQLDLGDNCIVIRPAAGQDQSGERRALTLEEQLELLFAERLNEDRQTIVISVKNATRIFQVGSTEVAALRDVSVEIPHGVLAAFRGRSGSGKTTLLNIIGGLDKPTRGEVALFGEPCSAMSNEQLTELRRHRIGFVFQSFAILPTLSAIENVELMLRIAGVWRGRKERAMRSLEIVGLGAWAHHRPWELSGGQQQRVAIARALSTHPDLILADEPTGELDSATGRQIYALFRYIVDHEKITVAMATHDPVIEEYAHIVFELSDGQVKAMRCPNG